MKVVRTRDGMHPRNPIKMDILSVVFMTKSSIRTIAVLSAREQNHRDRGGRHSRFLPGLSIPRPQGSSRTQVGFPDRAYTNAQGRCHPENNCHPGAAHTAILALTTNRARMTAKGILGAEEKLR